MVKEKEGSDDVGVMYLAPENDGMPILMWVWEKADQSDVNENPYLGFDINDTDSWIETSSFTEITLADMSEDYIKQFFSSDEPEYLAMLSGIQTVQGQSFSDIGSTVATDDAPTLHLMVVANTDVSDIGPACAIDQRRIRSEFSGIAKALGMKLEETLISGNNYSRGHVGQALNELPGFTFEVITSTRSGKRCFRPKQPLASPSSSKGSGPNSSSSSSSRASGSSCRRNASLRAANARAYAHAATGYRSVTSSISGDGFTSRRLSNQRFTSS